MQSACTNLYLQPTIFFKLKVVAQTERLITVERKVSGVADKETQDRMSRDLMLVKEQQTSVEHRVTQLERIGPMGGQNGWFNHQKITFIFRTPFPTV